MLFNYNYTKDKPRKKSIKIYSGSELEKDKSEKEKHTLEKEENIRRKSCSERSDRKYQAESIFIVYVSYLKRIGILQQNSVSLLFHWKRRRRRKWKEGSC